MIGENWLRVALTAMALGVGLYLIPLGMIANDGLIRLGTAPLSAGAAFLTLALGLTCISYALIGRGGIARRLILSALGLVIIFGRVLFESPWGGTI